MGMIAYKNYSVDKIGYCILFLLISLALIVLTGYGIARNRRARRKRKESNMESPTQEKAGNNIIEFPKNRQQ